MFRSKRNNMVLIFSNNTIETYRVPDSNITSEVLAVKDSSFAIMPKTVPINPKTGRRFYCIGKNGNENQTFNPGMILNELRETQKANNCILKLHNTVFDILRKNAILKDNEKALNSINTEYVKTDFQNYEMANYPNKLLSPATQQTILKNNLLKGFATIDGEKLLTLILVLLVGIGGGVPLGMYFGGDTIDNSNYDVDNNYPENSDNDTIIINYMEVLPRKINSMNLKMTLIPV